MSSEAAQKAYPEDEWSAGANAIAREAFDAGAVEALRQAAEKVQDLANSIDGYDSIDDVYAHLTDLAAEIREWEAGQ